MSAVDFTSLTSQGELSLEDILAIESAGSEKGIYQRDILDFVHSGKLGVPYTYSGKAAQSVKMGFTGAVEALQKKDDVSAEDKAAVKNVEVKIRKVKGNAAEGTEDQEFVFLINNAVVAQQRAAQSGQTATTTSDSTDTDVQ